MTAGALGLVLLGVISGGRAGVVRGIVAVHGGLVGWFLRRGMPLCWLRGFDAYLDNPFEREAYDEDERHRAN